MPHNDDRSLGRHAVGNLYPASLISTFVLSIGLLITGMLLESSRTKGFDEDNGKILHSFPKTDVSYSAVAVMQAFAEESNLERKNEEIRGRNEKLFLAFDTAFSVMLGLLGGRLGKEAGS